ncbi:general stress protein, partial [Leuconostoc mesenteroides]|nr:general stress protein [Leuconostoc mesenteroides]
KGKHAYFDWLEHVNWIDYTDETDIDRIESSLKELMKQERHDYNVKKDFQQLHDIIEQNISK